MSSLPPDVEWSQKNRVNLSLVDFFQMSADPNSTDAVSFKGIGTYTHIEAGETISYPGSAQRRNRKAFLPLGGPNRVKRGGGLEPELPDDVKSVYAELKFALEKEETLANSPIQRFGQLVSPQDKNTTPTSVSLSAVPSPQPSSSVDEEYLAGRRNAALKTIGKHLHQGTKEALKKALEKSGWPTKFTSVEAYKAPHFRNEDPWSNDDIKALRTIKEIYPAFEHSVITQIFFPGRSKDSIKKALSGQYDDELPLPIYTNVESSRKEGGTGYADSSTHPQKRKSNDGSGQRILTGNKMDGAKRRHSLPEIRDDTIMGGVTTESPVTTTVGGTTTESPVSTTLKGYYADRDPRMRGR